MSIQIYQSARIPMVKLPSTMPLSEAAKAAGAKHWCLIVEGTEEIQGTRRWQPNRRQIKGTFKNPGDEIQQPGAIFYDSNRAFCAGVRTGFMVIENGEREVIAMQLTCGRIDYKKLWLYEPDLGTPWFLIAECSTKGKWNTEFIPHIESRIEMIRRSLQANIAEAEEGGRLANLMADAETSPMGSAAAMPRPTGRRISFED